MHTCSQCVVNNIPRVTEILRPFSGVEYIKKEVLENAAARGTKVHALCAGIAKGNWIDDELIEEELKGYVKSFRKWSEAQVNEFIIIEKRYIDAYEQFTGQIDLVIRGSDNALYLVDLKTSARPQKTYPIQMAAYYELLQQNSIDVKGAMLVYLDKDGEFPEIEYHEELKEESRTFHAALCCYQYFKMRKKDGS